MVGNLHRERFYHLRMCRKPRWHRDEQAASEGGPYKKGKQKAVRRENIGRRYILRERLVAAQTS
jgi:hypothetical protein